MPKKRGTRQKEQRSKVSIANGKPFLYDAAQIAAERDVAKVLARYRDPAMAIKTYDHAPRGSRIIAELEHLLTMDGIFDLPIRDRIKSHFTWLKDNFHLPRRYNFYPRDHVPPEGKPYDEEFVRYEQFDQVTGSGIARLASGFANFNPGTGVFSAIAYSMGSTASVECGPIVTIEPSQHPADIDLTANLLLDYQYQLSASINPAFQSTRNAIPLISVNIYLHLAIDIRSLSGYPVALFGPNKYIKYPAELRPESTLPPFVSGYQEIVSGNNLQGSALGVPVTWEYTFAAPANCRVHVGVVAGLFVTATGFRGSEEYRYLGIADGRVSGQVTSVQAIVFT